MSKNIGVPSLKKAFDIWEKGIIYRCQKPYGFDVEEEYRFHTKGVATAAQKIAELLPSLNPEKAYILGLLHDYGKKINEKIEDEFHGKVGYNEMLAMGYNEVAKICLTHTFPEKIFDDSCFSYPQHWLKWIHNTIENIEYDDYDHLIYLVDKFFEGMSMVTIENRVQGIIKRYKINENQVKYFTEQSLNLKKYFDVKIGQDVYKILNIK